MKIKLWIYAANNGDGSTSTYFFNSKEEAEKYAKDDNERFCDDIWETTIKISSKGKLLTKYKRDL